MDVDEDSMIPNSLRDQVIQIVRADIVSGRSSPGMMYSVPTLAETLGVSTTPVREALLELSRTGLVKPFRNRGFRVETATLLQLQNLFAVRAMLERFAVTTLASQRLSDAPRLRLLADDVAAAVKLKNTRGYLEADRAFHQALTEQAGNPLLTRMVMELRDAMRLYGIDSEAGRKRQVASMKEHRLLIDLAAAGNSEGAAALISSHILDWQPIFSAALSERQDRVSAVDRSRTVRIARLT